MKANFTRQTKNPGDYSVVYGVVDGKDHIKFICPCGQCVEPVISYDLTGLEWVGTDEFPSITSMPLSCPEGRWTGELNAATVKPDVTLINDCVKDAKDALVLLEAAEEIKQQVMTANETSDGDFSNG